MSARSRAPYWLLAPGTAWLLVFFLIPLGIMGYTSLFDGAYGTPEGFFFDWNFASYADALSGRADQLLKTLAFASAATAIALAIAYPLAYAIAVKVSPRWRLVMLFAVIAPFFTTYLIRTIAWVTILGDASPIVDVLQFLQVIPENGRLLATPAAVIAGLTYNFLPFMILPIYASLEQLDTRLLEAGQDLYASARTTFRKVTLPLTAPGIIAGVLLTFIPAFGDYVNAQFLGGTNQYMIGNRIQSLFLVDGNYPVAAALSFLMMAAILIIVVIYIRLAGTEAFMGADDEAAKA